MSSHNATLTVTGAESRDDELFTAPLSDPTPDRHPSILRPGGHASPLKYPAVLRPGNARRSRTPSPNGASTSSAQPSPQQVSSPPVAYKAYSPPRAQSPSDELSAEIEGYFTTLEVPPLNINKPSSPEPTDASKPPLPPKNPALEAGSLEQRCASPPVPPKERIPVEIERPVASPMSELEASTESNEENQQSLPSTSEPGAHADEADEASGPPPAYDESQRVSPPPEKAASTRRISDESLAGAAVASAAQVGGAVAGISSDEAAVGSSTDVVAPTPEGTPAAALTEATPPEDDNRAASAPPPLPPRPEPSAAAKGKQPAMPGAFPAPPTQPVTSSYKASGAAATSAAGVGASVAGVGQSAGLKQARKALEKRIGHMIDKAKEHHHAREQHGHGHERKPSRKSSPEGGKSTRAAHPTPSGVSEVSCDQSLLSMRVEAENMLA